MQLKIWTFSSSSKVYAQPRTPDPKGNHFSIDVRKYPGCPAFSTIDTQIQHCYSQIRSFFISLGNKVRCYVLVTSNDFKTITRAAGEKNNQAVRQTITRSTGEQTFTRLADNQTISRLAGEQMINRQAAEKKKRSLSR